MKDIDPLVLQMTRAKVLADIQEYESILNRNESEEVIHQFLATHSYFFNTLIRLFSSSPLYSKIKFGDDFILDFCFMDSGSLGPNWVFIEIERADIKLFNKSGDPSPKLTHAIRQVQDWQSWIHENLHYARKSMPGISYPQGYVFLGRRKELNDNPDLVNRLKRINYDNRLSVEVRTLDYFINGAKSVLGLLPDENSRGSWSLPMCAKTHREFKEGLPSDLKTYLNKYSPDSEEGQYGVNERRQTKLNTEEDWFRNF